MNRFSLYLFREILPLYGAGLAVLLLLLLGSFLLGVLAEVIARGVPLPLVGQFLLYKLPAAAGAGIPLALLFASLLGLTRLSQDSEIKAALLLGVSPKQFASPMLMLGLGVSAISFINNEAFVPWSERRALEVQKDILLQSPDTLLQEGNFFTDALGRSIFIENLNPDGTFQGVTVIQPAGSQGPREVIMAEAGTLDEEAGVWLLRDLRFMIFRTSQLVLDFRAESATLPVRGLSAGIVGTPDLTYLPLRELLARLRDDLRQAKPAEWTALHRKAAEPLAATAFALFALAVSLYTFRRAAPLGIVSVLFLTFVYYATWSVSKLLGAQGTLPAWVAGWTPFLLYMVVGGSLLLVSWKR
ncbi:MAG: LptF/LptG family permease [Trueperaceae bacterium]|nr:MAG: LptF/LptG family permease [Trueperaceae bacterium]